MYTVIFRVYNSVKTGYFKFILGQIISLTTQLLNSIPVRTKGTKSSRRILKCISIV
jgi:hypothetical protein